MSAPDGARGLALLREQMPDLVLLGNKVGTMNVSKLIEVMRVDPAMRALPVGVYGVRGEADTVLHAGANVYIPTPCAPQEFTRHVVALIDRA